MPGLGMFLNAECVGLFTAVDNIGMEIESQMDQWFDRRSDMSGLRVTLAPWTNIMLLNEYWMG